jgi:hypothetical protein
MREARTARSDRQGKRAMTTVDPQGGDLGPEPGFGQSEPTVQDTATDVSVAVS